MGKLTKREEGEDLHDSQEKSKEMQIKHDLVQQCQAQFNSILTLRRPLRVERDWLKH